MQHPGCLRGFSLGTTMIRTKDIMASLPLVASVPGDRYGVTVEIGGKQACTDGRTITLPTLPLDCDAELLALARGFLDHEAAYIRYTDFEALQAARGICGTRWKTGAAKMRWHDSFQAADNTFDG